MKVKLTRDWAPLLLLPPHHLPPLPFFFSFRVCARSECDVAAVVAAATAAALRSLIRRKGMIEFLAPLMESTFSISLVPRPIVCPLSRPERGSPNVTPLHSIPPRRRRRRRRRYSDSDSDHMNRVPSDPRLFLLFLSRQTCTVTHCLVVGGEGG